MQFEERAPRWKEDPTQRVGGGASANAKTAADNRSFTSNSSHLKRNNSMQYPHPVEYIATEAAMRCCCEKF